MPLLSLQRISHSRVVDTSTEKLYLYFNEITGSIPTELGSLVNLGKYKKVSLLSLQHVSHSQVINTFTEWLSLGGNQITGSIPKELGSLDDLRKYGKSAIIVNTTYLSFTTC